MNWSIVFLISLLLMGCVATSDVIVSRPFSKMIELNGNIQHESGRLVPLVGYSITVNATNMFYLSKSDSDEEKRTLGSEYYWDMKESNWTPRNRDVFFVEIIIPTRNKDIRLIPDTFSLLLNQHKYLGVLYKATKSSLMSRGELCDFYVRDERGDRIWGHSNQFNPGESLKLASPMVLFADQEYCFAIKFNVAPPDPENEFTLLLKGFDKNKEVRIPFKGVRYQELHN